MLVTNVTLPCRRDEARRCSADQRVDAGIGVGEVWVWRSPSTSAPGTGWASGPARLTARPRTVECHRVVCSGGYARAHRREPMMNNDPFRTQRDVGSAVVTELSAAGFSYAEEVGRGGFGVVYRCTQLALDRTVAVKVLTAKLDEKRERFMREQRA